MGIITGYICLLLLFLLLAKFLTKRCHLTKINAFLMKIHRYAAYGFLAVGIAHLVLVLKVLDTRNIIVVASGIIISVTASVLVLVCHGMKDRKKELIFHRMFSLVIAVMLVTHIVSYYIDFNRYKTAISGMVIDEIDMDTVADGVYVGECDTGYIYARVKVTVNNHVITNVELLEHNHERGGKAEAIVKTIVDEQRFDADAVTGATNSSMVIEKACVNAITKQDSE